MMDRRAFLGTLGLFAAPLGAGAQPAGRVWRIGYLGGGSREKLVHLVEALESGLRDLGYVEGRNAVFEYRFADGRLERLPDLAAEMVRIQLDVIVAGNPQIVAVKQATTTIPIVMVSVPDPVGRGLVASLARPGGNITGLSFTATPSIGANAYNCSGRSLPACRGWPRSGLLLFPDGRRIFIKRRRPLGN